LSSIALGLSISKPLMSLGLFGLLVVWLVDGNLLEKIKAFYKNKTALIISSIYLLTIIGLFWTNNFEFALDDLRRKLPIFFIPFYVAGFSPITKKEFHLLLKIFIAGVLISSFWSLFVYFGGLNITIIDKRDLSRFNSHIRFGLAIALAIFLSIYFFFQSKQLKEKLIWISFSIWLISSLAIFSLFSGLIVFIISCLFLLLSLSIRSKNRPFKYSSICLFILLILSSTYILTNFISDFNENRKEKTIEKIALTSLGNKYRVDKKTKESTFKENGYYVEKHISDKEFAHAWNSVSNINYEGLDLKGNNIKFTLRRFVTSKGFRKDKDAVEKLSPTEIKAIENGIPNIMYLEMGYFKTRLFKILWGYQSYLDGRGINGHSVLMRWEYWKTAIQIIQKNLLLGVGTGDVQDSFNTEYEFSNSSLFKEYRLRAHNQFLTYGVSFGIIGMLSFLFIMFYPLVKLHFYKNNIYFAFFSIIFLSMLTEDTLEVQAGINLFAFFNTIFLLKSKETQQIK
jgi:hypothetical protein